MRRTIVVPVQHMPRDLRFMSDIVRHLCMCWLFCLSVCLFIFSLFLFFIFVCTLCTTDIINKIIIIYARTCNIATLCRVLDGLVAFLHSLEVNPAAKSISWTDSWTKCKRPVVYFATFKQRHLQCELRCSDTVNQPRPELVSSSLSVADCDSERSWLAVYAVVVSTFASETLHAVTNSLSVRAKSAGDCTQPCRGLCY